MHALTRRRWLAACAAVLPTVPATRAVAAAPFPQRPVRIVVPYSVGVGPDVVARAVAEQLTAAWSQPVLVDNKPGASGIVAFGDVRRTAPDGHTLYLADTATLAVNPLLHTSLPYDPVQDLQPLTLLFRATFLLWVGARNRFATLADLIAAARRAPGQVSYATLGNGHASHIAVETFARAAGLHLLHVPFKDAGALMTSVVSGDVDFTTFSMNTVAGLYAGGRLRPLAVAAAQRLVVHPEIPTLPQAGGPAVEMHPWAGLVTVAGTPAPLLARLQADLATALASTRVRSQAELAGFEITPSSPQALRARMDADAALVRPLLDEGRIARV
jgi:tripartite-type tricarboxylate transporter receptor subunit TctC